MRFITFSRAHNGWVLSLRHVPVWLTSGVQHDDDFNDPEDYTSYRVYRLHLGRLTFISEWRR